MYSLSNKKSFKMNVKAMHDYCFRFACLKSKKRLYRLSRCLIYSVRLPTIIHIMQYRHTA